MRDGGLAVERTTAIATALDAAEKRRGTARGVALTALAGVLERDASGAKDGAKVMAMAAAVRELGGVTR